jgi:hypothetical protein
VVADTVISRDAGLTSAQDTRGRDAAMNIHFTPFLSGYYDVHTLPMDLLIYADGVALP